MAVDNVSEIVSGLPPELASQVALLSKIIGALGGVLLIYLIFNIITFWINRRKEKKIDEILEEVRKINQNLLRKKK